MTNAALFTLLLAAGALTPGAALGQGPAQLAMARPQPHFVAAWAPKKEREAERSAVLARRVSLELTDVSLDAALKALTNQAGLRITYSPAVLPAGKRVTISASDVAVVTALTEMLFRSGLDVVVDRDGALALVVCRHTPQPEAEVQDTGAVVGRVTDKATGAAIGGATVVVEGAGRSATTDGEGQFRIGGVEAGVYRVRARYIGYAPLTVTVTVRVRDEVRADLALTKSLQVLDELVTTTPGGMQTEVKALPTPVSVITADDIGLQQPQTVQELFRQAVPGAVSWNVAARPEATGFSVRGASTLNPGTAQMKVFVNGIEAVNPGGLVIDPRSIQRIEVLRGPQAAAIYGSDAIGGVVQIFTKQGGTGRDRPEVEAQAALGVIQTPYEGRDAIVRQQYTASARGGTSEVSYNVGGGYSHIGDYIPNGEQSAQSNPSVFGDLRFARGVLTVLGSGRYAVQNAPNVVNPDVFQAGFPPFSKPQFLPAQVVNQTAGLKLGLTPIRGWEHTLTMGIDRFTSEAKQSRVRLTTPDDTLLVVSSSFRTKRFIGYNMTVQGFLTGNVSGTITAGVDHYSLPESQFFTSTAVHTTGPLEGVSASQFSTNNTGYFAQGRLSWGEALFLTAGIRAEENTEFGDSLGTPVSPRVGLSYVRPVSGTTLKLRGSWGRAIRAPDPSTKLSIGPGVIPNPELGPERQQGWDAGLDVVFGVRGSFSATYYNQTAKNLIQFVRVQNEPEPLDQFQNVANVKNTGVELEGSLSLGLVQVKANYAYTRARIVDLGPNDTGDLRVGDQVRLTPKHTAGGLLTITPRRGPTVTAGLAYVGRFSASDDLALIRCLGGTAPCPPDFNFVVEYPAFLKVNASVWQQITRQLSGFVSVENLTNNEAFELTNVLPVMGRISTAGLRIQY